MKAFNYEDVFSYDNRIQISHEMVKITAWLMLRIIYLGLHEIVSRDN